MGKSGRLRLSDVRKVFRLLGEVRELGSTSQQWRQHELEGLMRLTGANIGVSGLEPVPLQGTLDDLRTFVDVGWESPNQRLLYLEAMQNGVLRDDPSFRVLGLNPQRSMVQLRREFVDDATWYRSPLVNHYYRPGGCDDILYSRQFVPVSSCVDMITLRRAWGDKPFDLRSKRIVALFHTELSRLWRPNPAASVLRGHNGDLLVTDLPRHLQQIVNKLRLGFSEKEVATALRLSQHTIHSYIKELYSRLAVHSRSEAMAKLQWSYDFIPRLV